MSTASAGSSGSIVIGARHGYARRTALRSSPGRRRLSACAGKLSQRKTRGSRGLSVVVHAGLGRRAGRADLVGPTDMPGVRMVPPGLFNQCLHLITVVDGGNPGNEAAFPDRRFPLEGACRYRIVSAHALRPSDRSPSPGSSGPVNTGSHRVTWSPPPSTFLASTRPSWATTMSRAMARPSPQPRPLRALSAR